MGRPAAGCAPAAPSSGPQPGVPLPSLPRPVARPCPCPSQDRPWQASWCARRVPWAPGELLCQGRGSRGLPPSQALSSSGKTRQKLPSPSQLRAPGRPLAEVSPAPLPARTVTACVCPGLLERTGLRGGVLPLWGSP